MFSPLIYMHGSPQGALFNQGGEKKMQVDRLKMKKYEEVKSGDLDNLKSRRAEELSQAADAPVINDDVAVPRPQ